MSKWKTKLFLWKISLSWNSLCIVIRLMQWLRCQSNAQEKGIKTKNYLTVRTWSHHKLQNDSQHCGYWWASLSRCEPVCKRCGNRDRRCWVRLGLDLVGGVGGGWMGISRSEWFQLLVGWGGGRAFAKALESIHWLHKHIMKLIDNV